MDAWHGDTVDVTLASFIERAERLLVLDLTKLKFTGADGVAALLKSLRNLSPEITIHTVADAQLAAILKRANLGPCVSVSLDFAELAEGVRSQERFLTSRWVDKVQVEEELPLAA